MDLINRAHDLEKYTEAEMEKKLAKHCNVKIRHTVNVQDIKNKECVLHLLRSKDEQDEKGKKQYTTLLQGNSTTTEKTAANSLARSFRKIIYYDF